MRFVTKLAAALLIAGGAFACAGDVELVDRTQPNKVEKSIFTGEWFFRAAVIETDFNQGLLFEGYEGEMDRIRWEIQEDQLIAYRSFPLLIGAETSNGTTEFKGNPIAAFKILSHFDVIRQYNEATGEQGNVLVENTTDRPWYERDYMRIDWSQNLCTNPYQLEAFVKAISGAPYYVQEHEVDNPYRPEITDTNINVVGNYLLQTDLDTCYYTFLDPYFCGASQAKMKLSFMKVTDRDYEVMYYPDEYYLRDENGDFIYTDCYSDGTCDKAYVPMFERFGYFRHERLAYDHEYQWLRENRIFLGHRWNIWQFSHDINGNVLEPYKREPGEIVYHTNIDFPDDLFSATQQLVGDWDGAFRETVTSLKRQHYPNYDLGDQKIFRLERNSCNMANVERWASKYRGELAEYGITDITRGNLKRACAVLEWASEGDFTWQKVADLRHSFIHWVDTPEQAGPLGYGPSAADPVTGEIISANANVYGAAVDQLSSYAADVVGVMNGSLAIDTLITGDHVRDHIAHTRVQTNRGLSREKLDAFGDVMHARGGDRLPSKLPMRYDEQQKTFVLDREDMNRMREELATNLRDAEARKLAAVEGTWVERELLTNDDIKRAILGPEAYQPGQPLVEDASPLAWMLSDIKDKHRKAKLDVASHSILLKEWVDPGMVSVARELEGMSWDEVYDFMRRNIYISVTTHEVGHTLGLRHNFQGSTDALNYGEEFWSHFKEHAERPGEYYVDKDEGADQHMYASIMDYDARFYADSLHGIGKYDTAAIKFGYGMLVEAFPTGAGTANFETFLSFYNYTDFPMVFGEGGCRYSSDPGCAELITANGYYTAYQNAYAAALLAEEDGDREAAGRYHNEADYNYEMYFRHIWTYFRDGLEGAQPNVEAINDRIDVPFDMVVQGWTNYWLDRPYDLPDEVPYKYCPDELAYHTWVECKPWDKGANYLELTRDRMTRYEDYYFFTNFKRDRARFNDWVYVNSYLGRLYDRFFSQMSNVFIYSLYSELFIGYDKDGEPVRYSDFPFGRDWEAAGLEGLNFLTSIIEQPEPGTYCLDDRGDADPTNDVYLQADDDVGCAGDSIDVPLGIGKYLLTDWTDEYYYKATRIGTFWDKYAAIFALTDNEGFFYRDYSSYFDVGAFAFSYWTGGLQEELLGVLRSGFTGDVSPYAWRYNAAGADEAEQFVPAPVVDIYDDPFGQADVLDLPRIEGAWTWTLRWYSVVLPMLRYNHPFDYTADLSNYARVCLKGYVDCQGFDPTLGTVEYTDPLTGYTYMASESDRPALALGAELLRRAQDYVDNVYTPARVAVDEVEADPGSFTQAEIAARRQALVEAEAGVNEHGSFLDVIRQLAYLMD